MSQEPEATPGVASESTAIEYNTLVVKIDGTTTAMTDTLGSERDESGSDIDSPAEVQAGAHTQHYYYAGWRVAEERDGSDVVLAQTVWGTEYIDAPVCRDRNVNNTIYDPDLLPSCIDDNDERYFYHQDANFRVVALSNEAGEVVERYDYDAYGDVRIYLGHYPRTNYPDADAGTLTWASRVGNPYMHQGLRRDNETHLLENRMRVYHPILGRFMQRDPAGYIDSFNLYQYVGANPWSWLDPLGLLPGKKRDGGYFNFDNRVDITLPDGTTHTVFVDGIDDLKEAVDELGGEAQQIDIYGHGSPGIQLIGDDALTPMNAKEIGDLLVESGILSLHGCKVSGYCEEDDEDGDDTLQEIADNADVTVEAWPENTWVVPLPFGWTWYIERGDKETFWPKKDEKEVENEVDPVVEAQPC